MEKEKNANWNVTSPLAGLAVFELLKIGKKKIIMQKL